MTQIVNNIPDLLEALAPWRMAGERVAFVPTMGALHAGHQALMDAAHEVADKVIVSVFVNPKQFGPNEDYARYPVTPAEDMQVLAQAGVELVWVPSVEDIYPEGFATTIHVAGVSEGLCGAYRPGHFDGVATVVAKLFSYVLPHVALFGEKDYQQLCVIRRLVADLAFPIEIYGVSTVRENDGLALSSRNRYLSMDERAKAPALHRALQDAAAMLKAGVSVPKALDEAKAALARGGFTKVEYLEYRAEDSLQPLTEYAPQSRLLVAAWLGNTRLIDNIPLEIPDAE